MLMFLDAPTRFCERILPDGSQGKGLPATIECGCATDQKIARLESVDDGHRGGAVHLEPSADVRLGDMGMIADQPQNGDHLLRQAKFAEGLGKVPIGCPMSKADMKSDDFLDSAKAALIRSA